MSGNDEGRYNYPGYAICKVRENEYLEPARNGSKEFIESLSGKTDKDKVIAIADYISDRIYYDAAACRLVHIRCMKKPHLQVMKRTESL